MARVVGTLIGLLLAVAALGGVFSAYNAYQYERLQPYPLAWNHDAQQIEVVELERVRRELAGRLGSVRRMTGGRVAGLAPPAVTDDATTRLTAELEALDARIAALRAALGPRAP
jgi:hypothetical protein